MREEMTIKMRLIAFSQAIERQKVVKMQSKVTFVAGNPYFCFSMF